MEMLSEEFGKGNLVSPEILMALETLSYTPANKILQHPELALKDMETRAGSGKNQLTRTLACVARQNPEALFGAILGMETMMNVVQSVNTSALLGGLSTLIDNLTIREKESQAQQQVSITSLQQVTKIFNKTTEVFQKCTTGAETLLFTLQDVQSKMIQVPSSTPRSLSSMASRSKESSIQYLRGPGRYKCVYGTLIMTENGFSFSGSGKEASLLSELSSLSKRAEIQLELFNLNLEQVISFLDKDPKTVILIRTGSGQDRLQIYTQMVEQISDTPYQWSEQRE